MAHLVNHKCSILIMQHLGDGGGVIQALDHPWLHLPKTHGVLSQWRPETHEGWGDPVSENRTEESKTSQSTLLIYYGGGRGDMTP